MISVCVFKKTIICLSLCIRKWCISKHMNHNLVDAQINKPPSLFDRCGQPWGSGSTGGRSSTPSEPEWPRPCPSPRHLHGSAFTASSSPHRYERGDRLCPTDVLLGETTTPHRRRRRCCWLSSSSFSATSLEYTETLSELESEARERERGCISLRNLRRDVRQSFRRKWMTGTQIKDTADFMKREVGGSKRCTWPSGVRICVTLDVNVQHFVFSHVRLP